MNDATPSLASRMYPEQAAAAPKQPAAEPAPAQAAAAEPKLSLAERMYPGLAKDTEAEALAARKAEAASKSEPADKSEAGSRDTGAAPERSEEQIAQAATELATELELDTADPMSGTFAREAVALGLEADGARKLAEMHYEHNVQRWDAERARWRDEALAAPNASDDLITARIALAKFGDPQLGKFLAQGYGDHPAIISFLARVGRAVG
jgi:hypothetical protein